MVTEGKYTDIIGKKVFMIPHFVCYDKMKIADHDGRRFV